MGALATSTVATATAYGNQRKIDRTANGVLWAVSWHGDTWWRTHYSTDQGATWTAGANIAFQSTGANHTPSCSLFIDADDYAHLAWKDRSTGFIHYRRGTPNALRTAYTWSASIQLSDAVSTDYPDVVAHREGTGWFVHVVWANTGSTTDKIDYRRFTVAADGTIGPLSFGGFTATPLSTANSLAAFPSIDFHHTGDGKTVQGGTPHLFLGWSSGASGTGRGLRFRKATYSAGAFTWSTDREIDSTRHLTDPSYWLTTVFDGTRVVLVGFMSNGSSEALIAHERDAADTATSTRVLVTASAAADSLFAGSATYDAQGNLYALGRDGSGAAGTRKINARKWTRSTSTLEPVTTLDTTGGNSPYVSARRSTSGSRLDYVYTDGTTSPYPVVSGQVVLNNPPTAPVRTSPVDGQRIDRALPLTLDWDFTDPDTGDTQSAADIRYRPIGATTYTTAMVTTATAYVIPAGTLAPGDYEWAVRTYDAQGAASPWSSTGYFTAANAPAAPVITAPAPGTVPERVDLTWSVPAQEAYQVQRLLTSSGAVLFDTARVADSTARARTLTFPTDDQGETLRVRVEVGGLWSPWSSVAVQVAYTPPAAPVVTLTAVETIPGAGPDALRITITNPPPGAGQPAVVSHDVLIDHGDGDGLARRATGLPAGQPFTYHLPVSGRDYSGGRVQVVAVAANGTTSVGSS